MTKADLLQLIERSPKDAIIRVEFPDMGSGGYARADNVKVYTVETDKLVPYAIVVRAEF